MYKKILLIFFLLIFIKGCAPTPFSYDIIMFDTSIYSETNPDNMVVYTSRLDIPRKYYEFGTIKFKGIPIIDKIKQAAATKGADALIRDSNNFILIKYKEIKKEDNSDETKTI